MIIGDCGSFSKTITDADIVLFAGVSGDFNPIHINDEFAKNSIFEKRIAHGMLSASFISTVLGMYMPGPGTIYLEQNLKFRKPVYIGDTITAKAIVSEVKNKEKGIYKIDTLIVNQDDCVVTDGYAIVKYLAE